MTGRNLDLGMLAASLVRPFRPKDLKKQTDRWENIENTIKLCKFKQRGSTIIERRFIVIEEDFSDNHFAKEAVHGEKSTQARQCGTNHFQIGT